MTFKYWSSSACAITQVKCIMQFSTSRQKVMSSARFLEANNDSHTHKAHIDNLLDRLVYRLFANGDKNHLIDRLMSASNVTN